MLIADDCPPMPPKKSDLSIVSTGDSLVPTSQRLEGPWWNLVFILIVSTS